MTTKTALIARILQELATAQETPMGGAPQETVLMPPLLPIGDGNFLPVTRALIDYVDRFAQIVSDNDQIIAQTYATADLQGLVHRAFGQALATIDLDHSSDVNCCQIADKVAAYLKDERERDLGAKEFIFGAWFLRGHAAHDFHLGPVRMVDRISWSETARAAGQISTVTERRLRRSWSGKKLQKRIVSMDEHREQAVLDAVGKCPAICSVRTVGLVGKAAEQKALLTARLAHTAISLLWLTPSVALEGLALRYDGHLHYRNYAILDDRGGFGSSSSWTHVPGGQVTPPDWDDVWSGSDWLKGPVGEALSVYVEPARKTDRPKVLNALFLALWWFHQACLESAPLMAVVKFAASMDALADGGKRKGIVQLIETQRGPSHRGTPILTSGETVDALLAEIYDYARSRTIHGTNKRFGHDWSGTRARAEVLARLCLRMACNWASLNPERDDLAGMQRS